MKIIRKTNIQKAICLLTLSTLALGAKNTVEIPSASDLGVKDFQAQLSIGLNEQTGRLEKGTINKTKIKIQAELEMNDFVSFHGRGGIKYETGSTQSVFNERRNTPDSNVIYDYAFVRTNLFANTVKLDFGSLDNNPEKMGSFIQTGLTSVGVQENFKYESKYFDIELNAIQSKPQNDELSNRIESVEQGSPKFFYEYIKADLKLNRIKLHATYGQYAYDDLSNSVAFQEQFMGNSIVQGDEATSRFIYKYKGTQFLLGASFKLSEFITLLPSYEAVENNNAPSSQNMATNQQLIIQTSILDTFVELHFNNFKNERDVTPTFYMSSPFTANTEGSGAKVVVEYNGFETSFGHINRKEVKEVVDLKFSDDEKVYFIEIRKNYDFI